MSAAEPKPKKSESQEKTQTQREERAPAKSEEPIDFSKLDLSIEKVEERISPGETNVFDK